MIPELTNLQSTDTRFNGWIELFTEDGGYFFYPNAFITVEKVNGVDYIVVYSEHNGYHHYMKDSITHSNASIIRPSGIQSEPEGMGWLEEREDLQGIEHVLHEIQNRTITRTSNNA